MESFIDIDRLIAIRGARGWDQKQLADAAAIDRSVISRLERRLQTDCRLSVLVAMAYALEVPVQFLIRQQEDDEEHKLTPELDATIERLRKQPMSIQRHASMIIVAFLKGLE